MDQPCYVAQSRGRLDERMHGLARGHVDRRDAHFVSGVAQDLCRRIGVVLAHVGQQDVLTYTDPPGDGLAIRPGPMTTITSRIAIPFMSDLLCKRVPPCLCVVEGATILSAAPAALRYCSPLCPL